MLHAVEMDDLISMAVAAADTSDRQGMGSGSATHALHVVHGGWLAPPACMHWSTAALSVAPQPPPTLDDLFVVSSHNQHIYPHLSGDIYQFSEIIGFSKIVHSNACLEQNVV